MSWFDSDLVVLDFDGPVTRLLPEPENVELARAAADRVVAAGRSAPEGFLDLEDHGMVLREVARRWPDLLADIEEMCTRAEVAAAATRPPAAGAVEFIVALDDAGTPVAIVTNNAADCVRTFLDRFALTERIASIHGRLPGRAGLLKPSPAMLLDAASRAGVEPGRAVMVGDSLTDIVAAGRAGMVAVGVTSQGPRRTAMLQAGAVHVVPDTAALLTLAPSAPTAASGQTGQTNHSP